MKRNLPLSIAFALLSMSSVAHASENKPWYTGITQNFVNTVTTWYADLRNSSTIQKYEKVATITAASAVTGGLLAYFGWNWLKNKRPQNNPITQNNQIIMQFTDKTKIVIEQGDITQAHTQAIVNAANAELAAGGGVCGAIFNAAGLKELQAECDAYPQVNGIRCPTGWAIITTSGALVKRGIHYIIHAVGPDCRVVKDEKEQDKLLQSTYENTLALADRNNINSIAFPFISSAIYAFPKERAARIALETIMKYALKNEQTTHLEKIVMILFSKDDYVLFDKALLSIERSHLDEKYKQLRKATVEWGNKPIDEQNKLILDQNTRYAEIKKIRGRLDIIQSELDRIN